MLLFETQHAIWSGPVLEGAPDCRQYRDVHHKCANCSSQACKSAGSKGQSVLVKMAWFRYACLHLQEHQHLLLLIAQAPKHLGQQKAKLGLA